jgi:hypothetical protein
MNPNPVPKPEDDPNLNPKTQNLPKSPQLIKPKATYKYLRTNPISMPLNNPPCTCLSVGVKSPICKIHNPSNLPLQRRLSSGSKWAKELNSSNEKKSHSNIKWNGQSNYLGESTYNSLFGPKLNDSIWISENSPVEQKQRNFLFKNNSNLVQTQNSLLDHTKNDTKRHLGLNPKNLKEKTEFIKSFTMSNFQNLSFLDKNQSFAIPNRLTSLGNSSKTKKIKKVVKTKPGKKNINSPNISIDNILNKNSDLNFQNHSILTRQQENSNFSNIINTIKTQDKFVNSELITINKMEDTLDTQNKNNTHSIYQDRNTKCRFLKIKPHNQVPDILSSKIIPLESYIKGQIQTCGNLPFNSLISRLNQIRELLGSLINVHSDSDILNTLREIQNKNRNKSKFLKLNNNKKLEDNLSKISVDKKISIEKNVPKPKPKQANKTPTTQINAKSSREAKIISISGSPRINPKRKKNTKTKRCHCDRSKCLRLHCVCFKNGKFCSMDCGCKECYNIESNREIVEEINRTTQEINPHAFESRIVDVVVNNQKIQITKGCKCSKNHCNKKYCECRKLGVVCSTLCRCSSCLNDKIDIDPDLASKLSKRKSRKKKKIILTGLDKMCSK